MTEMDEVLKRVERQYKSGDVKAAFLTLFEAVQKLNRQVKNMKSGIGIRRIK